MHKNSQRVWAFDIELLRNMVAKPTNRNIYTASTCKDISATSSRPENCKLSVALKQMIFIMLNILMATITLAGYLLNSFSEKQHTSP